MYISSTHPSLAQSIEYTFSLCDNSLIVMIKIYQMKIS